MATPPPKLPAHPLVSRSRHAERRPVPKGSCRGACPQTAYSALARIHRMKWRSSSSAGRFRLLNQTLTLDQVAEFRRTRRVKEGTGSSATVSAAFSPVGPIHPGNPGYLARCFSTHALLGQVRQTLDERPPAK